MSYDVELSADANNLRKRKASRRKVVVGLNIQYNTRKRSSRRLVVRHGTFIYSLTCAPLMVLRTRPRERSQPSRCGCTRIRCVCRLC